MPALYHGIASVRLVSGHGFSRAAKPGQLRGFSPWCLSDLVGAALIRVSPSPGA